MKTAGITFNSCFIESQSSVAIISLDLMKFFSRKIDGFLSSSLLLVLVGLKDDPRIINDNISQLTGIPLEAKTWVLGSLISIPLNVSYHYEFWQDTRAMLSYSNYLKEHSVSPLVRCNC